MGAALVAGAAFAVLAEGPQSAIPLAVDEPPPITAPAEPQQPTPEPAPDGDPTARRKPPSRWLVS